MPLSLLNDFLYCSRRAALKLVEGWRSANEHTVRGTIVHDHADLSGYEVVKGVTLHRALPIWSERLGLSGKCDIVEQWSHGALVPVEFKLGRRREWDNDNAQLCAQALCLEEMFGCEIPSGAIFHVASKRRREVVFDAPLPNKTEEAASSLHAMLGAKQMPLAVFKPACEECSLYEICLPRGTKDPQRANRLAREALMSD